MTRLWSQVVGSTRVKPSQHKNKNDYYHNLKTRLEVDLEQAWVKKYERVNLG